MTSRGYLGIGTTNPQRAVTLYSATADNQLQVSGTAPSVTLTDTITGATYQAKFGLATASNNYSTGSVAGDFIMSSQSGSLIWAINSVEKMRVATSGYVGIGNTSPVARLSVYTTSPHGSPTGISVAAGTGGANLLARDSSNYHNWFPYTDGNNYYSADGHIFRSSNHSTNWAMINSTGLGLGTQSPSYLLHVTTGSTNVAATFSKTSTGDGLIAYFTNTSGSGYSSYIYIGSGPGTDWKLGKNVLNASSSAYFNIVDSSNNERFRIDNASANIYAYTNLTVSNTLYYNSNIIGGNYGTNTYKRNLFLTIDQSADTTWFRIYVPQDYASDNNGGTIKVRVVWCGVHATFGQYQDFEITYKTYYPGAGYTKFSNVFNTNKTTDFAGATYYPASSTPNVQFYDNSDGYLYAKITGYHSGYNRLRLIEAEILGRTTATPVLETCSAPGSPSEISKGISFEPHTGTITTSGDIIAYGSPSDNRLKTIKEKVPHALDTINKISGYRFDWKNPDEVLNIKEDIGVIAQEVQDVLPELVRTNENGFMSVRHQGLTAVLIEAVKEQQTQIEDLKSQIKLLIGNR